MNDIVIEAKNLTKSYPLYDRHSDRFKEVIHPFRKKYHKDFFALQDVSFELRKGETLGVMGKNGSGKSTLLKIVTGVLSPTSGSVSVHGRIASLLELGIGFNYELSGIDNVYFYGSLNGFSKDYMNQKIDAIISFADIGDYINQPVKTYSSGMYSRLAFAAAIHIEPKILIIDEVLSVGDIFFQQKCIHKMREMFESGTTILYVSHSYEAVQTLCKKGLLLNNGSVEMYGDSKSVSQHYFAKLLVSDRKSETSDIDLDLIKINKEVVEFIPALQKWEGSIIRMTDDHRWIQNLIVLNSSLEITSNYEINEDIFLRCFVFAPDDLNNGSLVCRVNDETGLSIGGTASLLTLKKVLAFKKGMNYAIDIEIENSFAPGLYSITVGLENVLEPGLEHNLIDGVTNAGLFSIKPHSDPFDLIIAKCKTKAKFSITLCES